MGWALSVRGKHKQSLGPWLELHKRTDIDVAVQESLLAVPYALSELGAYKQALQHYENAITVYNAEIDRLGQAVGLLRAGELLASVVSDNPNYGPEMRTKLSDLAESHYLVSLFVAHDFQETLRNYRAMQSISQNLGCWSATLAREKQHDLPTQLAKAKQAMTGADEALDAVDSSQWCGRLNASHRWQLSENFEPSLWLSREARDQLSWRAGDGASATETVIEEEETVAEKQERLKAYSAAFGERVAQLHAEINRVMHSHALYLQQLVATELDRQRKQLRSYLTQARFGIAQVYDRSAGLTETR
jgi:tetratricopeptide (TPR) repeat protein